MLETAGHIVIAKSLLTEPWTNEGLRGFFGSTPVTAWFNPAAPRIKSGEIRPEKLDAASAIALEPTEALTLPREQLRDLVASEPAIRDALLAALSGELRRLTTHVAELHFLDLTGRLAARLARLAEEHGERLADGAVRLDAPLTQSDLAAMIGATRQSVNKLLGEFEAEGLLKIERDSIVVPNLVRLSSAAHR